MSKRTKPHKQGARSAAPPDDRRPGGRRRRVFIAICLLLPVALLAGIEGIARLCGLGGYPGTVRAIGAGGAHTLVVTDTTGAASYFDAARTRPGSVNQYTFRSPKPAGTVRIVLAGGSAIKGFPQPMGFAPSAFLQEMLGDVWPDRRVEVINLGTTAVASFPALDMLTEMLDYEPDLAVIYTGHNEFFGAYGVASMHHAANSPGAIRFQRWYRSLGIAQLAAKWFGSGGSTARRTLMEAVVGRAHVAPDSSLREAAAGNLYAHLTETIERCQERAVPVIVCTLASNERGLAPIGTPDLSHLSEKRQKEVKELLARAAASGTTDPAGAIDALRQAVGLVPHHATAHFRLGQALDSAGDVPAAREHYRKALDLDPMPWRAPTPSMEAIRRAASDHSALLCDVQQVFRDASPGGLIGWELMDDHVHPSLRGQWLLARSIVERMGALPGDLEVRPSVAANLPDFESYRQRMGDNEYDRYGVVESLCRVLRVPFMEASNPEALTRFKRLRDEMLAAMPEPVRQQAIKWAEPSTHRGFKIPLSGMVGRVLIRQERFVEADQLFGVARRHVPSHCGAQFEYTYFLLASRQQARGRLADADVRLARETIAQIKFYLQHVDETSGQPERYAGRLHQLLGEFAESVPHLASARERLRGTDLLAVDQALIVACVQTGDLARAREVVRSGLRRNSQYAAVYRKLQQAIPPG